jgi:1,5-anhydro-D-fructose reductase (1,5-anhydro-D-mannitol-forming)
VKPPRWGIIGYGWVARDYMRPAILAAGHELVAVADPFPQAQAHAVAEGIASYRNVEELIAAGRCDMVYVATPNRDHADPVTAALASDMAVLCEKPMAASLDDAEAIATAALRSAALYGTAFDQRYHPAHRAMADAIAAGDIGKPVAIRIVYACWVDPRWSPTGGENWRADPAAAGGGAVIDLALHGLDLAQLLLGEPVDDLHIVLQRRIHDYAVDDGGMIIGRTASGVLVSLHVAYNCPSELPRRRLEVIGGAGQLVAIDTMGQTAGGAVTHYCGCTGVTSNVAFDAVASPFTAQVVAFAAGVAGAAHDFSAARDIALMRAFDAAHERARACL